MRNPIGIIHKIIRDNKLNDIKANPWKFFLKKKKSKKRNYQKLLQKFKVNNNNYIFFSLKRIY